ncbi:hypothetical protein F5Y03DRAFT_406688 [Xylaria venustula]|nr:hypothetical protein F5Y03DRAFT_406688 [Xylaria venustula]
MDALEARMDNIRVDPRALCCNNRSDSPCSKVGSLACKNCLMVAYCSKRCQTAHWPAHRKDCQSPIMKGTWMPRWVTENRIPAFMGHGAPDQAMFGVIKYLWGNVPAFDVIQLGQNESIDFQEAINLLFAESYRSPLHIVINDHDIDVVARNLIFLLIMFVEEDPNTAADAMLHVWYSALVTESCYSLLQKKLKPIVEEVCSKIAGKDGRIFIGKTWVFGSNSLRLILTQESWMKLPLYFDVPRGMTKEKAHSVRQAVVNAPSRVDYVDRAILIKSPAMGLGMMKYRNDGVLIPFGQACDAFVIPNPTVFDSSEIWPMMDNADPTGGWSTKAVLATKAGPAKKDLYGQLHHYLKRLFTDFHHRLHTKVVHFELHHVEAEVLSKRLAGRKFDRIEVSNICDSAYLGIKTTLKTFGPLLRDPSANPHATLITVFLNAVFEAKEVLRILDPLAAEIITTSDASTILKYIEFDLTVPTGTDAGILQHLQRNICRVCCAADMVGDMDGYFNLYMSHNDFAQAASSAGVEMKKNHTIISPWPLRVDGGLHPTQKDKDDFKLLLGSAHSGKERYVEWKVGVVKEAADTELESEDAQPGGSCLPS